MRLIFISLVFHRQEKRYKISCFLISQMIYRFGNNTSYGKTLEENNLSALTEGISKDITHWNVFLRLWSDFSLLEPFKGSHRDPVLLEQGLSSLGAHKPCKFWLPLPFSAHLLTPHSVLLLTELLWFPTQNLLCALSFLVLCTCCSLCRACLPSRLAAHQSLRAQPRGRFFQEAFPDTPEWVCDARCSSAQTASPMVSHVLQRVAYPAVLSWQLLSFSSVSFTRL